MDDKGTPDFSRLHIAEDDGVLHVRLDRSQRKNAFDLCMLQELEAFWGYVGRRSDLGCIILSGNGEHFSLGGDIKDLMDPASLRDLGTGQLIAQSRRLVLNMLYVECPIVCAVQGVAAGLAANIALLADILVLSDDARLGDAYVRIGLASGDSGPVIWPLVTPVNLAKQFLMLGDCLGAAEELMGFAGAAEELTFLSNDHVRARMAHARK